MSFTCVITNPFSILLLPIIPSPNSLIITPPSKSFFSAVALSKVSNLPPNFVPNLLDAAMSVVPNLPFKTTSRIKSFPPRLTTTLILSLGLYLATCSCNSPEDLIFTPLNLTSISPFLIPAAFAAPPSNTSVIIIPSPSLYFTFNSSVNFFNSSSAIPSFG